MIKLLSLFSGIGAFEKALTNLGIDFELLNYCEIDKYASCSYSAVHNQSENKNLVDVTKIDPETLGDFDLLTHGSPCQDFSVAGLNRGGDEGTNTRSSLMWCTTDIVKCKKPKFVIWENVKNVLSKQHKHNFDKYIECMEEIGYNNYYKVLNSKDFGVPQNRERVYVVSIRRDIDNGHFNFPIGADYGIRLIDILEPEVDEKYYIEQKKSDQLIKNLNLTSTMYKYDPKVCMSYQRSDRDYKGKNGIVTLGLLDMRGFKQIRQVYSCWGISPTLTTMEGGNRQPKVLYNYRVRKLTPLECWRLQGFSDQDFLKCEQSLNNTFYNGRDRSNSQLYKQAGNSITVNVLEAIYEALFKSLGV